MGDATESDPSGVPSTDVSGKRLLTVPNMVCVLRMIGSLGLIPLALANQPRWTLAWWMLLSATDWIDGKLARSLDQRTTFGARLDSIADAVMYAGLLFAASWLKGEVLFAEWIWIAAALLTYAASVLFALVKFRRLPSYHTWSAKSAWLLIAVSAAALLLDWSVWPLRAAMLGVAAANGEAMLITGILPVWRTDVKSFLIALRMR